MPSEYERRAGPRVSAAMMACIHGRDGERTEGVVRDASPSGILVEVADQLLSLDGRPGVEICLPTGGRRRFRARVARRSPAPGGGTLVALRLDEPAPLDRPADPAPGPPGGAAPARPRPAVVLRADLRVLGGEACGLALTDLDAPVPDWLCRRLATLSAEIGLPPPEAPATARELIEAVRLLGARA